MSSKLSVRPKPGLVVKNPLNGMPLPADRNTAVDANQFWLRRLKAGDVVMGPKAEAKEAEPPAEKKKKKKEKPADKEEPSEHS